MKKMLLILVLLLTIKPNYTQTLHWDRHYDGPGNSDDYGKAVVTDNSGNVYVTGYVFISSPFNYDYATIKYNSEGVQQWVQTYNGPSNHRDEAHAIAVDNSGNVYVTGRSFSDLTFMDYATIKYNTAGVQQWVQRYNGTASGTDEARSIAVDNQGNVYVTGSSTGAGNNSDITTIKYNTEGVQQWVQRYRAGGYGNGIQLVLDNSGNVYVTGATGNGYSTIKYNSNGEEQWVNHYNGGGFGSTSPSAIAFDSQGNIYVTGSSVGNGTASDYATIKINSTGIQQWEQRYNGPANGSDEPHAITVDDSGNVYVTGQSFGGSGIGLDFVTIKYNSAGVQQWLHRYNGPVSGTDQALAIGLDAYQNVYVTGRSSGTPSFEMATIMYSPSGDVLWVERYSGGFSGEAASIAVIPATGEVIVAGTSFHSGSSFDITTVRYLNVTIPVELISFTASLAWQDVLLNWSTASETNNIGFEIERLQNFEISKLQDWEKIGFVEGKGTTSETNTYSFIDRNLPAGLYSYRLKQIDFDGSFTYSNVIEVEINSPEIFSLEQNYPNPFNPTTTIRYSIPQSGLVSLKVYDVLGREVAVLVNEEKHPGVYEAKFEGSNLASGIYLYTLNTGEFTDTKKLLLVK